mmetsp:Transcript_1671/g.3889  ORF Transcript_1671/g.3889 Transcript_1671/m.3889 type:complete len:658 (-) Transcript_1671:166-2139(-)|eukprot:CAMPEP_0114495354 /NCGR_PEP_ID=MMETSP0109-20121206/5165_1 /TAXON_ID=29199 /ORGANISM="Chlorarachnion reptans, Strain CCCM449" /LENGTH=657 /DNA_ID=CAMNT_0001672501 /DNA_START=99 /DNA_END=2072 /DNA_ORIENTATION=+
MSVRLRVRKALGGGRGAEADDGDGEANQQKGRWRCGASKVAMLAIVVGAYYGAVAFFVQNTYKGGPPVDDPLPEPEPKGPECVTWHITLEGERYTHAWGAARYKGLSTDTFKQLTVVAGGERDPSGGVCLNFGLDQKILITDTGYLAMALSCANQEIAVKAVRSEPRECGLPDRKLLRGLPGPYSEVYSGPGLCEHLFECGQCLRRGSKDVAPDYALVKEPPGTKCGWCPSENACVAFRAGPGGARPCDGMLERPDEEGEGGGEGAVYGEGVCPRTAGKRYLSFQWNNGRVNNNMVAWAAAMAMGKHLDRTVILAQPIQKSSRFAGHRRGDPNHGVSAFLGVLEGMWDLEHLSANGYETVLELSLSDDVRKVALFETPQNCVIAQGYPNPDQYADCKVVHMSNPFRYQDFRSQRPKEFIRPAKWIRDASERIITDKMSGGGIKLSVHQRHHAWGHEDQHGSKFLCRGKLKNIHSTPTGGPYREAVKMWTRNGEMQKEMLDMTQLSCALDYTELRALLRFWKQEAPSTFFLASDREDEARFKSMVDNGAVTVEKPDYENLPEIKTALEKHLSFGFNCSEKYCASLTKFKQLTGVFIDMWGMTKGDFFMGGYYSTMSDTVCYWRGLDRMNSSNLCFLPRRLKSKWVIPGENIQPLQTQW